MTNMYLFIILFAVEFIIIGYSCTKTLYPLATFKQLAYKVIHHLTFGITFSLVTALISNYFLKKITFIPLETTNMFLILLSIISIIVVVIARTRVKKAQANEDLNIDKYVDKSVAESTYALVIFCIIAFVGINVPPFSVIPLWFGLCAPFFVIIPGYLITNTLFPRKGEIALQERLGIAIFVSLILMSIIGFTYAQVCHSLNMRIVTLIMLFMVLIILIPAYILKTRNIEVKKRFSNPTIDKLFIIMAIIALIAVISSGIYVNAETITNNVQQGNTTFEIEGITQSPSSDGYYEFEDGEELTLNISLTNQENADVNYKISVQTHNDSANKEISTLNETVKNGQKVDIPYNLTMTSGKKDITFTLYKDDGEAYKIKHLYVNIGEGSSEESE